MTIEWAQGISFDQGPKYQVLRDAIVRAIETQALSVGEKLPPVRDLAWKVGVTPGTVARAYTILTDEGRLEAAVGRGTFVAEIHKPVMDDVWARYMQSDETENVSLISPYVPDVGQVAAIQEALSQVGKANPRSLMRYPSRGSYQPIRETAVAWLSDAPLGPLSHKDLVLTHGGQNGISMVLQAVAKGPKPVIMVEELSYAGFRRAAEMLRLDVVSVPMDAGGIIPEELARIARETRAQILCTSPEVHNPTTLFTNTERRQEIVRVARQLDFQILEDDCYRIGAARAPCYRALAPERAWYVTSISKILTPSMRIGFAVSPEGQGASLRRASEYGFFGLAWPLAEAMHFILGDPRTRKMADDVRKQYDTYLRSMINILGCFDLHWQKDVPFVWMGLPRGWRSGPLLSAAEKRGVKIRAAEDFSLRDDRAPHAIRIAINAQVSLARFESALADLHEILMGAPEDASV